MTTVGLRELRQNASELVRRAESGEEITVSVSGRPVARLTRARTRTWATWEDLEPLLHLPPDPTWEQDLDVLDQSVRDPWSP